VRQEVDLKHFRYFLAVADEGTFTGAAGRLRMTQPALSRAIRALEDAAGTALFVRSPQGAELTEAGRVFRGDARSLVELASAALNRAARQGRDGEGLRVTARACDVDVLARLVDSYNERYPRERPARAAVPDWRVQASQVRAGETDVTLMRCPFGRHGLDSDLLRAGPRVALLPQNHPLAGREVIRRSELAGETFPVWPDLTPAETAYWTGTDLTYYPWRPGPVVHDAGQFAGSIRLGQAVGFIAKAHLPELPPGGISVVPVTGLTPSELRITWASTATSPDIARFVRHATEVAP
jgi:DNA-binding transcriptional LysR family regulator